MNEDHPEGKDNRKVPGKGKRVQSLPKRFYKTATAEIVAPADAARKDLPSHFQILLDGRPVRTPGKRVLSVPHRALAEAIAAEWSVQAERIDPETMPLTKLVNTALDGVSGQEAIVAADISAFANSDLLCYRAEGPEGLVSKQSSVWDPLIDWAHETLGAQFRAVPGLMPVAQPPDARSRIGEILTGFDALALTALHVMTTLTGSAILALAHARGRLSADEAWAAAHIDEDWQISQWGEDWEARERRDRRRAEFSAASRLMSLIGKS